MKRTNIKDRDLKSKTIDVKPLNQREKKLDTRKGMIKQNEVVNINWLEKNQLLFP